MCGIWAIFSKNFASKYSREQLHNAFWKIKGRGPDASSYLRLTPNLLYGFHRLAINDTSLNGMQPFIHQMESGNTILNSNELDRIEYFHEKETLDKEFNTPIWENENYTMNNGEIAVQANGEIYNCPELAKKYGFKYSSSSDCEVIPYLYKYFNGDIEKVCHSLDGVFAFTLYDKTKDILFAARDPIGVRPLFIGRDERNDSIIFASEGKAIVSLTNNLHVHQFKPGSYWRSDKPNEFTKWWHITEPELSDSKSTNPKLANINIDTTNTNTKEYPVTNEDDALLMIREDLIRATKKRLMADRPIGCFLSGGLDSSLITGIVSKLNPYTVNTYAVGMKGGTDFKHAAHAAKHLNCNHYEIEFTPEEGISAVEEVIYALETFDITTIRASVGMYLMSQHITKNTDDIVIYSGEGSDEVTQGYLYFHNSPCPDTGNLESQRLVNDLHYFDVKRVDRTVSTHGLEVRVPFLDKTFVKNYFKISPELRRPHFGKYNNKPIEKYLVRKAFDNETILKQCIDGKDNEYYNLLPESVLWRTKEALSDGVSGLEKPWHVLLGEYVEKHITDTEYENACQKYKECGLVVPISKESYYYRKIYEKYFGDELELIPYYWLPKWSGNTNDPSARTINVYEKQMEDEMQNGTTFK